MITTPRKAVWPAIALGALALVGCGSDGEDTAAAPPRIPAATGTQLAELSDRIAADLDAGDVCGAAERADELSDAIERARLPERFREVEAVATTLVNDVNCPPPPEPVEPKKEKKGKHGRDESGGDDDYESAQLRWPGDNLPPGQAKKIGGD